jgi:hypothetical protein
MNKAYAILCGLFVLVITGLCGLGVVHLVNMTKYHSVVAPETAGTPLPAAALPHKATNDVEPGDSGSPKVLTFSPFVIIFLMPLNSQRGERMESEDSGSSQISSDAPHFTLI